MNTRDFSRNCCVRQQRQLNMEFVVLFALASKNFIMAQASNSSIQPPVSKIRLVGDCFPNAIYHKNIPNGSIWYGSGMSMLKSLKSIKLFNLPPYEIITKLSPSNVTFDSLQTVADGRADLVPMAFGVTYQRFKMVDFSYMIANGETRIHYAKTLSIAADPIEGVFDWPSYGFIALSILASTVVAWVSLKAEGNPFSIVQILIYNIGHLMNQQLPMARTKVKKPRRQSTRIILGFLMMFLEFVRVMYCSIIIRKLTAMGTYNQIDSLEDLYNAKDVRIFITKHSFIDTSIEYNPLLNAMRDRIDYFNFPRTNRKEVYTDLYEKVLEGTHVMIDDSAGLDRSLRYLIGDCRFMAKNFGKSTEVLFTMTAAWPLRKKFPLKEKIDKILMKLESIGINALTAHQNDFIISNKTLDRSCPKRVERTQETANQINAGCNVGRDMTLGVMHIKRITIFYGVGMGIAVLAFLGELIFSSSKGIPPKIRM